MWKIWTPYREVRAPTGTTAEWYTYRYYLEQEGKGAHGQSEEVEACK